MDEQPLIRLSFDAAKLLAEHPPRIHNRNKQIVFDIACRGGAAIEGTVVYTRWQAMMLPPDLDQRHATTLEAREDVYDYTPPPSDAKAIDWHVNFADPQLFFGYGSSLFAQDEMQIAEHPILASLREALLATNQPAVTIDGDMPTPVLVRGAQRRVAIATDANRLQGRPHGLYGNRFADASPDIIRRATQPIVPPTITNLIAIAAPAGGSGTYTRDDIYDILTTAFTGFRAACLESQQIASGTQTTIHTGFWGCGAFGGNRVLMALLQLLAAHLAQANRLVFHTFDRAGAEAFDAAQSIFFTDFAPNAQSHPPSVANPSSVIAIIRHLVNLKLKWGMSDGN